MDLWESESYITTGNPVAILKKIRILKIKPAASRELEKHTAAK